MKKPRKEIGMNIAQADRQAGRQDNLMRHDLEKWIIFSLVLLGVVFYQFPVYAGTWSQTTQAEFETGILNGVDTTSNSGIVTVTPTDNNTIVLLHFDEGSGEPQDSSGNGNHAGITGASWTSDGKFGNALSFDGNSGSVNLGNKTAYNLSGGDFTLEAWFKLSDNSVDGIRYGIIARMIALRSAASRGYCICRDDNNHIAFTTSHGTTTAYNRTNSNSTYKSTDNNWHHVAAVYDSGTKYLYIDGIKQSDTDTVAITDYNSNLRVGNALSSAPVGDCFYGSIDEVRVSNIARRTFSISGGY